MGKTAYFLFLTVTILLALSFSSLAYAPPPDNGPPLIGDPVLQPASPTPNDPVTVSVNVTDDLYGVKNVTIVYTIDNWQTVNETLLASYDITAETATTQIPAQANGGHVAFYIVAFDNHGNRAVNNNTGSYFTYDVSAPGFLNVTSTWLLTAIILAAIGASAVVGYSTIKYHQTIRHHTG